MGLNAADGFLPPPQGKITVVATTATTVFALDFSAYVGQYVTCIADDGAGNAKAFYITHGPTSTISNPSPTSTSTDTRTWGPEGVGSPYNRLITQETKFAEVYPIATGYFRWYPSSQKA